MDGPYVPAPTGRPRPPAPVATTAADARPPRRAVRFLIVGVVSATLDVGLLVAGREWANLPIPVATTVAFWIALLVNFALNRSWSFRARGVAAPFARYLVIVGANWLLHVAIVSGGAALGVPYVLAKIAAIGLGALFTYVSYDRWVFV